MSVFKVGGDGLLSKGNIIAQSNVIVFGDVRVAEGSNVYIGNNAVITELELGTSLSALRAALEAPVANVLYVATNGDDNNSGYALSNALANIHTALERAEPWTTIFVKSGEYVLYNNPVTIPRRVGLVGDNLRTTTIRPQNNTSDMFYLNNGCYVTQITFRDHLSPAAVFSYNPDGSAGAISTSPYIQNCSSITTTGTGMRVDGNYVTGLRSMVCDAYTQTNSGGVGIHMLNRGYTQLVSVFTICCEVAILCESGGFCSVTNSNSSFGTYGLKADGVSEPTNFGKYVSTQDTEEGQTFTFANLAVKPNYGDAVLFATYDQAKCLRDAKLIVDSLAIDLAYNSNTQSTFAGLQYWAQAESAIPNQADETIAAFSYAQRLASNIAQGLTINDPYQGVETQVAASGAGAFIIDSIDTEFNLVANIITGGTSGITDRIEPNSYPPTSNAQIIAAANAIYQNYDFIKAEVIAFVNDEYPGFFANASNFIDQANAEATCSRDVGYLLDSVRFDILHGGNRQAIMSGVYYYNFNADVTQINDQVVQTGAAYDFIGTIIDEIVTNANIANVGFVYQTEVAQNTNAASAATTDEANIVLVNIDLISDIITEGPNAAPSKRPITYEDKVSDSDVINAVNIILANKDFIAAEVVAYVNQNWANISNGAGEFYTVASSSNLENNVATVTFLEFVDTTTLIANSTVSFHQPSYISSSGHTFEYVGSGTNLATALPYAGGVPIQTNEIVQSRGGRVYFTSTDQQGDFRIGTELVINRVDGTIQGRTFNKALFAVMTPYLLAIEG